MSAARAAPGLLNCPPCLSSIGYKTVGDVSARVVGEGVAPTGDSQVFSVVSGLHGVELVSTP